MMKKTTMCLTAGLAFCAAFAGAEEAPAKDAPAVEQSAKLKEEYKVDDARIQSLRDKKLNDSEINKVLAIAEKMPGGITDANVNTVVGLRQGPPVMGWGQIAQKQGFKLGSVMGKGADKKAEKADKPAKAEKAERPEKAAHPEKAERPERPAKAEHGKR